jgi:hypothetical protein
LRQDRVRFLARAGFGGPKKSDGDGSVGLDHGSEGLVPRGTVDRPFVGPRGPPLARSFEHDT